MASTTTTDVQKAIDAILIEIKKAESATWLSASNGLLRSWKLQLLGGDEEIVWKAIFSEAQRLANDWRPQHLAPLVAACSLLVELSERQDEFVRISELLWPDRDRAGLGLDTEEVYMDAVDRCLAKGPPTAFDKVANSISRTLASATISQQRRLTTLLFARSFANRAPSSFRSFIMSTYFDDCWRIGNAIGNETRDRDLNKDAFKAAINALLPFRSTSIDLVNKLGKDLMLKLKSNATVDVRSALEYFEQILRLKPGLTYEALWEALLRLLSDSEPNRFSALKVVIVLAEHFPHDFVKDRSPHKSHRSLSLEKASGFWRKDDSVRTVALVLNFYRTLLSVRYKSTRDQMSGSQIEIHILDDICVRYRWLMAMAKNNQRAQPSPRSRTSFVSGIPTMALPVLPNVLGGNEKEKPGELAPEIANELLLLFSVVVRFEDVTLVKIAYFVVGILKQRKLPEDLQQTLPFITSSLMRRDPKIGRLVMTEVLESVTSALKRHAPPMEEVVAALKLLERYDLSSYEFASMFIEETLFPLLDHEAPAVRKQAVTTIGTLAATATTDAARASKNAPLVDDDGYGEVGASGGGGAVVSSSAASPQRQDEDALRRASTMGSLRGGQSGGGGDAHRGGGAEGASPWSLPRASSAQHLPP